MDNRLEKVVDWLKKENIQTAFVHSTENVFYLTNFHTNPHERLMGLFVFQDQEPFFICPGMETSQAKAAGWNGEIIGYADHEDPWQMIKEAIDARKITIHKAAIEKDTVSFARAEKFLEVTDQPVLVSLEDELNEIRLIKDDKEIEILKRAAELADFGVEVGVRELKTGVTEMEVLAKIEYELKKKGIREMSFSTMVLFGEKSGQPHGNPGSRALKEGDFVLFDLGVVLEGYCSDITRTVVYQSVSDKQKQIYEIVLKAQIAALEASKPGVRIGDLDKIAREFISEAGYGDYFPHRLGHGLGINVHEYPSMAHTNDSLLKEGMTYTIEPGVYVPEIGGVRIEDDVVITANGAETLTKYPKELQIIKK
ncbi:M24 family metallopeptidase [Metabacillus arenae]|uniref:Aminopeptidase P family protein n=1 Tax=Metabacillus arenae TaxID=2771434 RepID=A0A926S3Y0_9BACI|nr:Xaa-Pro peptidase family protein [Metabacillus arenae]MBD1383419.1 aminopeptidase P family protein [Metabacillus arenae]